MPFTPQKQPKTTLEHSVQPMVDHISHFQFTFSPSKSPYNPYKMIMWAFAANFESFKG